MWGTSQHHSIPLRYLESSAALQCPGLDTIQKFNQPPPLYRWDVAVTINRTIVNHLILSAGHIFNHPYGQSLTPNYRMFLLTVLISNIANDTSSPNKQPDYILVQLSIHRQRAI